MNNIEHEHITLTQRIYHAFGAGDLKQIIDASHADCVWELVGPSVIPYAGRFVGHGGLTQFIATIAEYATIEQFSPREFFASGDTVVVLGEESCLAKSTNKRWSTRWVHVFRFKEGKVINFFEHLDTAALAAAFS